MTWRGSRARAALIAAVLWPLAMSAQPRPASAQETGADEAGADEAGAAETGADEAGADEAGAAETGAAEGGAETAVDPAELAVRASDAHHEYCAEIYSGELSLVAAGYKEVAGLWEEVDAGHEQTSDPVLLYWRGVLALCLGQDDLARADLQGFLDVLDDDRRAGLRPMVRDARQRLDRLDAEGTSPRGSRHNITLSVAGGLAYGPLAAVEYDAWVDEGQDHVIVDWLESAGAFRASVGVEVRVIGPLLWGLSVGFTTGRVSKTGAVYPDMETLLDAAPLAEADLIEEQSWGWFDVQTWIGLRWWPDRIVSPVVRAGVTGSAQGRAEVDEVPPELNGFEFVEWDPTVGWPTVNIAGYLGMIIDSAGVLGVDVGVWVGSNTVEGLRVEGLREEDPADAEALRILEAQLEVGSTFTINPRVALRLTF